MVKNLPAMGENSVCPWVGKIPEGSPGGGHGNHSSILAWRIPMDRGAWWATVHVVAQLDTTERLSTELMVDGGIKECSEVVQKNANI